MTLQKSIVGTLLAMALFVASLAMCGCSAQSNQEASSSSGLPQLTIGCSEYRPFVYTDNNGNLAGIDIDIATEACKRMGYQPEFKSIEWETRNDYLNSGEVDCLWSCYSMTEREDEYAWAGPYMLSRQVVAVPEESPIQSLADLADKRIAVKASTKPESIFLERTDERIPQVEGVYCLTSMSEVAAALRNEYVDACAGHEAALTWYLQNAGISYRLLDEDLMRAKLGVAFSPNGNAALREQLSTTLAQMREDGTTARILESYGLDAAALLQGDE